MRVQQFLETMRDNYPGFELVEYLASQQKVNGGWEVWFQVEMAICLINALGEDDIVFSHWIARRKKYTTEMILETKADMGQEHSYMC